MGRIYDSELKILEVLWKHGDTTASDIARILGEECDWSRTTTYTVIKKCVQKGLVARKNPKFICQPLITKKQVREQETTLLVNKVFDGSSDLLIANLIDNKKISSEQLEKLRQFVLEESSP